MSPSGTELLAGAAIDLAVGDPRWIPHPIRAIGWWAARAESLCRRWPSRKAAGVIFWIVVVTPTAGLVWLTMAVLPRPWIAIYWIWSFLAIRSLDTETTRAIKALVAGDLSEARRAIAMVVGRDTDGLDEEGVLRAAVETVAENLSDAIVAPLFYLALAGPPAMAAYKAINTLDSMVGYKNDRYRDFGWWAARADDVANFIPARLTAALIWMAAALLRLRVRDAIRITLRDGASQPSPNAGWPEAAVAGALGVRLGGTNYYRGVPSRKAPLGDGRAALSPTAYARTRWLLYATSLLAVAGAWSIVR